MTVRIESFRDLRVYQAAFDLQQSIYKISRTVSKRRNVLFDGSDPAFIEGHRANLAEAWQKMTL